MPGLFPPASSHVTSVLQSVRDFKQPFFLDICAGAGSPLSSAFLRKGVPCLSIDILLDTNMDLLQDDFFEHLLRICTSRQVALAHAAPPCREYSRLKLRPRGPKALRTPAFLNGLPDLSASQALRVQESHLIFVRCVQLLHVSFSCGAQVSLEQPPNSMAWMEPIATNFLASISADLVDVAACSVNLDMHKAWLFATSFRAFQAFASTCPHTEGTHVALQGLCDEAGNFRSRAAAEYPPRLADMYAEQALPLFDVEQGVACALSLATVPLLAKLKALHEAPVASQDGAGILSTPDWSAPPSGATDVFAHLRPKLMTFLLQGRFPQRLRTLVLGGSAEALFSSSEIDALRRLFQDWLSAHFPGIAVSCEISAGQPYCLQALAAVSRICRDRDVSLFTCLEQGVPTGFDGDIPLSNVFLPQGGGHPFEQSLGICHGNWSSAEADLPTLHALVEEEIANGWFLELDSLEAAQERFGDKLAIGKMSIVKAEGKKPRLVVDSTVCGTNPSCSIPETYTLPGIDDVRDSFPLRCHSGLCAGFAFDIKSAHKTVRVRDSDQGLLGVSLPKIQGPGRRWLFYRVCPFGANFSALWFQRLGSFFLRTLHLWTWLRHALLGYVDDFMLFQDQEVIGLTACMTLAFCALFNIPLSNAKLQLGSCIHWIGWHFSFGSGTFSIPVEKVQKLKRLLQEALQGRHVSKRTLDKVTGLLQWFCKLYKHFKPWLQTLYADANRPLATNYSIDPGDWPGLAICVNEGLVFTSTPPGTSIPTGAKLIEARHLALQSKKDLAKIPTSKRIWMRVTDPSTTRRKLSVSSRDSLQFWLKWCEVPPLFFPLQKPADVPIVCAAADARADGDLVGIGGFIEWPSRQISWFSQSWRVPDLSSLGVPLQVPARQDITCYETLAQLGLILCLRSVVPLARWTVRLRTLSDNTGAEAGINKLYSSAFPLSVFLKRLSMLACMTGIELDVFHIPGEKNDDADLLSRWSDESQPLPAKFLPDFRVDCSLARIWHFRSDVRLWPHDAKLKWQPP